MMCKWGENIKLRVTIPADTSHTGKERIAIKKIDKCLAPLIKILNDYGIKTTGCCCGHGKERKSFIGISAKNVYLGRFKNTGLASINIEFPYKENKMQETMKDGSEGKTFVEDTIEDLIPHIKKSLEDPNVACVKIYSGNRLLIGIKTGRQTEGVQFLAEEEKQDTVESLSELLKEAEIKK